jgi:uncharacterized repeat protein (TIGR01451 family)
MPSSNFSQRSTLNVSILSLLILCTRSALAVDTLTVTTVDNSGDAGVSSSITVIDNQACVAYYDTGNTELKLWIDDGNGDGTAGDGIGDPNEIRTIEAAIASDAQPSIAQTGGTLAVAYYAANQLNLWIDDGGITSGGTADDFVVDADEFRIIDSLGNVGQQPSVAFVGTRLAISYYDATNTALKLWVDDGAGSGTADDNNAQGDEIRTLDPNDDAGTFNSLGVWNNHLVVAYYVDADADKLLIWIDDGRGSGTADDGNVNGTEIRTIDTGGVIGKHVDVAVVNGYLAVVYYDETNTQLKLWYDDGTSGGSAGDGIVDAGERRILDSGNVGEFASITSINGVLAVSYYDAGNDNLLLWRDDGSGGGTPRNGKNEGGSTEVRIGDNGGGDNVGQATSIAAGGGNLLVSYYDVTNTTLLLLTAALTTDPDDPNNLALIACSEGTDTTDTTPMFSFDLSDVDPNTIFNYQIQIDDSDDTFASLVLDYTSEANVPSGTASFTVGQDEGGGTYNTGTAGQMLGVGDYFWRVRCNDGTTDSDWVEGDSFSITEPTISLAPLTIQVNEASTTLGLTVTLSTTSCESVTVDYVSADGTATAGSDFTALSGTLTFQPGDRTETIDVTIINDNLNEPAENFTVTIQDPNHATLSASVTSTITIEDNDTAAVSVDESFNSTIVQEGELTDSYGVVLTSQPTANVNVVAQPAGEVDLGAGVNTALTLTFTPANWNTAQTVTVTAVDDTEIEDEESATITHTVSSTDADYNNFPTALVSVTIRDNDTAPVVEPPVTADPNDSNTPQQPTPPALLPELVLTASAPGTNVLVGETITFNVALTNNGGTAATNTEIRVPVPSGLSFVSAVQDDGSPVTISASEGTLTIELGALDLLQTVTIKLTFTTTMAGSFRIEPTAIADNSSQQAETASNTVLAIEVTEDTTPTVPVVPCFLFPLLVLGLLTGIWKRSTRRSS